MRFYPETAPVPAELRADEFLLRMLQSSDVELDFDAVIASRPALLLHSGGRWPREGFTIEENLADLQGHEADHHRRTAFTYTVMNPLQTVCLGCVYSNPLQAMLNRLGAADGAGPSGGDDEAVTTFWVRPSHDAVDLDRRLLGALRTWFSDAWAFRRMLFMANVDQARQLQVFEEAGLRRVSAVETTAAPQKYYFYE